MASSRTVQCGSCFKQIVGVDAVAGELATCPNCKTEGEIYSAGAGAGGWKLLPLRDTTEAEAVNMSARGASRSFSAPPPKGGGGPPRLGPIGTKTRLLAAETSSFAASAAAASEHGMLPGPKPEHSVAPWDMEPEPYKSPITPTSAPPTITATSDPTQTRPEPMPAPPTITPMTDAAAKPEPAPPLTRLITGADPNAPIGPPPAQAKYPMALQPSSLLSGLFKRGNGPQTPPPNAIPIPTAAPYVDPLSKLIAGADPNAPFGLPQKPVMAQDITPPTAAWQAQNAWGRGVGDNAPGPRSWNKKFDDTDVSPRAPYSAQLSRDDNEKLTKEFGKYNKLIGEGGNELKDAAGKQKDAAKSLERSGETAFRQTVALLAAAGLGRGGIGAASPSHLATLEGSFQLLSASFGRMLLPAVENVSRALQKTGRVIDSMPAGLAGPLFSGLAGAGMGYGFAGKKGIGVGAGLGFAASGAGGDWGSTIGLGLGFATTGFMMGGPIGAGIGGVVGAGIGGGMYLYKKMNPDKGEEAKKAEQELIKERIKVYEATDREQRKMNQGEINHLDRLKKEYDYKRTVYEKASPERDEFLKSFGGLPETKITSAAGYHDALTVASLQQDDIQSKLLRDQLTVLEQMGGLLTKVAENTEQRVPFR